jgi:hypothetical protein
MPDAGQFDDPSALVLEIHLGVGGPSGHPITASSDAGDAAGTFLLPPDWEDLAASLRDFHDAKLPTRGARPVAFGGAPERPVGTARDLGRPLFRALFAGRLSRWYDRSRGRADVERRPLRLRLRIDDPALSALPWELLFDPDEALDGDHLCLTNVALARHASLLAGKAPVTAPLPLRILGMAAVPKGLQALDVAHEQTLMERAVQELMDSELVTLEWVKGGTLAALTRKLDEKQWHVFHFVGHGLPGTLSLVGEGGEDAPVDAAVLAKLLDNHASLRLVVLNTCKGAAVDDAVAAASTAAVLAGSGVPAVVAMQCAITDQAATHFARAFYEAIAARRSLGTAVTLAREAIFSFDAQHAEWAAPVLYLRADDDRLFDLQAPAGAGERKPATGAWGARAQEFTALSRAISEDPASAELYLKRAASYLAASAEARGNDPTRAARYAELATDDLRRAAGLEGPLARPGAEALQRRAVAAAVVTAEELREQAPSAPDAARIERVAERIGLVAPPDRLRDVAILWVDDEPWSVANEAAALRALGARVDPCESTKDALAKLRKGDYALVVSDVQRGSEWTAGYDLIEALRSPTDGALPDPTPVIIYSWPIVGPGETREEVIAQRRAMALHRDAFGYACYPQELIDLVLRAAAVRPVVARFHGLTVALCEGDAGVGCFEARGPSGTATYAVDDLALVRGGLPIRERRIVEAWAELRHDELRAGDARRRAGEAVPRIAPIA